MKLARLASHLYPRWWRERYGDEFAALLDDARPGIAGAFDIAKGALIMQLTTWSPGRTMAAFVVLGLAISGAILAAMPREYTSQTTLAPTVDMTEEEWRKQVYKAVNGVLGRTWLQSVIDELKLYPGEDNKADVVERFRRDIRFSSALIPSTKGQIDAFRVSFEHSDPRVAQRVAGKVAARILDELPRQQFGLYDPPTLPKTPSSPNKLGVMGMGLAASIAIGGVLALVVRWRRNKKAA